MFIISFIPVARRAKLAEEAAGIEGVVVGIGCRCCFGAFAAVDVVAAVSGCRCRPRMRFWRGSMINCFVAANCANLLQGPILKDFAMSHLQ